MPRKRLIPKKKLNPDPVYNSLSVSKFTKTGIVNGRKPSYKKAIVQLKEGEFIDFYSQI